MRRVLWWILVANWAVAAVKLSLGLWFDSTAMTADGLHSFIDGGSNVIALVAMHFASRPADVIHPYGHQKFESLASLGIGVMIGVMVFELAKMAVHALWSDVRPEVGPLQLGAMVGTLLVNLAVTRYESAQGRKLKSTLLLADASHTLSDVFVTLAVIVSLGLTWMGIPRADALVALAVLVFVAATGWSIVRQSVGILADSARIDPDRIRDLVRQNPRVQDARAIRSRGLEGSVYVDLVVLVDPLMDLRSAHTVADEVEAILTSSLPEVIDVVVHLEPGTSSEG